MDMDKDEGRLLELDAELFTLIVTKLLLQNIFQLRCVCKAWRTLLTDDHILTYFFQLLSQTPIYMVSLDNGYPGFPVTGFAGYSVELRSWHRWTLALHSKYFLRYKVYGKVGDRLLVRGQWVKRGRGGGRGGIQNLCLVDPTKRVRRKLPSLPEVSKWPRDNDRVALIPGESSESYRVLKVKSEDVEQGRYLNKVFWFDSEFDSWKTIWPWEEHTSEDMSSIVFHDGELHCILSEHHETWGYVLSSGVCRYDEQNSCWQKHCVQVSEELDFECLFEWQRQLFLMGGQNGERHNQVGLSSIDIWQLDKDNHVWIRRERMPDHIMDHFFLSEISEPPSFPMIEWGSPSVSVGICGHYIWLANSKFDPCLMAKRQYEYKHVVYDLSKSLWSAVPEPPSYSCQLLGFSHLTPKCKYEKLWYGNPTEKRLTSTSISSVIVDLSKTCLEW